jgi:hypothetical protein
MRWGRYKGRSFMHRRACERRNCPDCNPKVVGRKLDAIPDDVALHAVQIERADWSTMTRRLHRARGRGEAGDYARIALSDDRLLIVSDAPIGKPITRAQIAEQMLAADPAHGQITVSKAWQAAKRQAPVGFVDEGIVTADPQRVVDEAVEMGLKPTTDDHGSVDFGVTTDEQHERLRRVGRVLTNEEYAQLTYGSRRRRAA